MCVDSKTALNETARWFSDLGSTSLWSLSLLQHCIFCSFIGSAKMTLSWCKQLSQPPPEAPEPPPGKTSWWEAAEPGGEKKWGTCCSQRSSERAAFNCSTFCTRNHPCHLQLWRELIFPSNLRGLYTKSAPCGDTEAARCNKSQMRCYWLCTKQSALISTSNTISCNICLWSLFFLPEYLRTIWFLPYLPDSRARFAFRVMLYWRKRTKHLLRPLVCKVGDTAWDKTIINKQEIRKQTGEQRHSHKEAKSGRGTRPLMTWEDGRAVIHEGGSFLALIQRRPLSYFRCDACWASFAPVEV